MSTVEASGAVPAAEFPPAVPIYAAAPFATWVGVVIIVAALALGVRRSLPAEGTGADRADPDLPLPWSAGSWVRWIVVLWSAATVATFVLAVIESWTFTTNFVPELVSHETATSYRLGLGGLAFAVGAWVALVAAAYGLAVAACTRLSQRVCGSRVGGCALGVGLAGTLTVVGVTQMTLWSEITQVGLWTHVAVIGSGLCLLLTDAAGCALRSTPAPNHARPVLDAVLDALPRIVGGSRPTAPLVFVVACALAAAGLGVGLYPDVEDFRMQLFPSFAMATVLFIALALIVATRTWAPSRIRGALAPAPLVLGAASLAVGGQSSEVHLVAHEYARFGQLVTDIPTARWLHRFEEIGLSDPGPDSPPFPHHTSGTERWTPLPASIASRGRPSRPPVIIVVWDAARPDRLTLYGHDRPTSPHLDALAKESVVFERAYASATATTVGVKGLLSGKYSTRYMLATDHPPFLTGHLADLGWDHFVITVTGNDHNGVSADAFRRGWDQRGRDVVFEDLEFPNLDHVKPDGEKTDAVLATLRERAKTHPDLRGTFAYLHLTGPHIPWTQAGIEKPYGREAADRYDAELTRCDRLLGRLTDGLRELGVLDDAVIVVTADHGTALGEHGKIAGYLLYEEQLRVPLVMKLPGVPAFRVTEPVTALDVAPTLLHLLDPNAAGKAHGFHGRSLVPLVTGSTLPPRPFVAFCAFWDSYAIYDETFRYKLHHHRGRRYEALFDLEADPAERVNLIGKRADVASSLRERLEQFLWEGRSSYGNPYHYREWSGVGQ